jgi:hypothetical protein
MATVRYHETGLLLGFLCCDVPVGHRARTTSDNLVLGEVFGLPHRTPGRLRQDERAVAVGWASSGLLRLRCYLAQSQPKSYVPD